jgi:hypothetical protein
MNGVTRALFEALRVYWCGACAVPLVLFLLLQVLCFGVAGCFVPAVCIFVP